MATSTIFSSTTNQGGAGCIVLFREVFGISKAKETLYLHQFTTSSWRCAISQYPPNHQANDTNRIRGRRVPFSYQQTHIKCFRNWTWTDGGRGICIWIFAQYSLDWTSASHKTVRGEEVLLPVPFARFTMGTHCLEFAVVQVAGHQTKRRLQKPIRLKTYSQEQFLSGGWVDARLDDEQLTQWIPLCSQST